MCDVVPPPPISDEQLARKVQDGCDVSFEQLHDRMRPRVMGLLLRRTGSHADAEDLTQQAMMRAYRQIDRYDPQRPFAHWMLTIAVRLSIDHYRSRRARIAPSPDSQSIESLHDVSQGVDPAEALVADEQSRQLWALADQVLSDKQRTALWLHSIEQMSPSEIAAAMNVSKVHVRVLLHRSRKTMLKHWDCNDDMPGRDRSRADVSERSQP